MWHNLYTLNHFLMESLFSELHSRLWHNIKHPGIRLQKGNKWPNVQPITGTLKKCCNGTISVKRYTSSHFVYFCYFVYQFRSVTANDGLLSFLNKRGRAMITEWCVCEHLCSLLTFGTTDRSLRNLEMLYNGCHATVVLSTFLWYLIKTCWLCESARCERRLTLRLLMSYIYGAPSKARNANVVYIWTCVWQRWNSLFLFAAQCFNIESMQRGFLCHICV